MKQQVVFKLGLLMTFLITVFISCETEYFEKNDDSMSVAEAKAWFETHQPEFLVLKSGKKNKKPKIIMPGWKGAFSTYNDEIEIVETHVLSNGGFGFATFLNYDKWIASGNNGYITSLSRIVVLRYKKSGEMVSFIMTILGDAEYLVQKDFQLWNNTYLEKDNVFSGLILYHSLEGQFVNGWRYTNGQVTHTVTLDDSGAIDLQLKTGYYDCTTYDVYGWHQDCTDYYTVGEVDDWSSDPVYSHTTCGDPYPVYEGSYQECVWVDTGSGGGGEYDPQDGNQSSSLLASIKNEVILPPGYIDVLETELKNLTEEHCLNQSVFNSLVDLNFKISFKIKLLNGEPAGYDPQSNTIYFAHEDAITSENLKEELFHAWQDAYYLGGIEQYYNAPGQVQIEFEAKLYKEMTTTGCCYIFKELEEIRKRYMLWVDSIKDSGNYSFSDHDYMYWLNLFNLYHPEYSSPLSNDLNSPNAFRSVISSSNCN